MLAQPRLLDLFCRAGGAGHGYALAGFEITGVDLEDMAGVYPGRFIQGDALDYVRRHAHEYDVIHASPPCQAHSALTQGTNRGRQYPQVIPQTRAALTDTGKPWVIENVAGAPIRHDLMLCGEMFGLSVIRHRFFEIHTHTHRSPRLRILDTADASPACDTAAGIRGRTSPSTGTAAARDQSPNGRKPWGSTGRTTARTSPRPYHRPTPSTSASASSRWCAKPRLLDLFCCQGGAARGYADSGFEVTGVDISPQPHYPFAFVQADAVDYAREHAHEYDVVHASPPCQRFSKAQRIRARAHPDLIGPTREALRRAGVPYIIENVVDAAAYLIDPVLLCGAMFGLRTYRHRLFETSGFALTAPPHPPHLIAQTKMGRAPRDGEYMHIVGNFSGADAARQIMQMPWATREGLREAVPPAYTRFIAGRLLAGSPELGAPHRTG